ncbi:hypothetical protein QTP86_024127, partial [Hemibagrus guttatus]
MLQTISPDLLPFITTVINGSLTSGHVPTAFKKARVIPILKKPALDPSDISNYRPNNLHDPNQSGFKAAHSTETALLAVTEKLHAARSAKLSSVLILLDLSAAFDTVNHKTLLSTLRSLGICGTAWEWFASYLDGRSYQRLEPFPRLNIAPDLDGCAGPLLECQSEGEMDFGSVSGKLLYRACVKVLNKKKLSGTVDTPWRSVLGFNGDVKPEWTH